MNQNESPAAQPTYTREDLDRAFGAGLVEGEKLAIEEAAALVQEPVAYAVYHRMGGSKTLHWPEQHSEDGDANEYKLVPLYTTPPGGRQSEDCLTNAAPQLAAQEEIQRLSALVRAQQITIEKLEAQRPVALPHKWVGLTDEDIKQGWRGNSELNTTPPAAQQQCQCLTNEEVESLLDDAGRLEEGLWVTDVPHGLCRAIEAKLREKNGGQP